MIDWGEEFKRFLERENMLEYFSKCVMEDRHLSLNQHLYILQRFDVLPEKWVLESFQWRCRDSKVWIALDARWGAYVLETKAEL